jgi:phospholipid-binding lipoprotein MlaA
MPSEVFKKILLSVGGIIAVTLLAGCATPPEGDPEALAEFEQLNDPLEPTNRAIFEFNDQLDTYFLRPVAQGYRAVVPKFGRARIADFLDNMKSPLYFANDLLQGDVGGASVTVERFLLNSTFGVGGIMDVAAPLGLPGHKSDFGLTLGSWGLGEGPYLVLPLFGPSNPRDAVGLAVDSFGDPVDYYFTNNGLKWASWSRTGLSAVSQREAYLDVLDDVKRTSLDYYSALRSLYRQRRNAQINEAKDGRERTISAISSVPELNQIKLK